MKLKSLSDDALIENAIDLGKEFRRRFGKTLGITGEVGEYLASQIFSLERVKGNINKGFDARDSNRKRVQIKTRICNAKTERTSLFSNFDFDYVLLVLLSEDYEVLEIYRATSEAVEKQISTQSYRRPSISIGKFMKLSRRVYP